MARHEPPDDPDARLREEMDFHLETHTRKLMDSGVSRDERRGAWLRGLAGDLRHAARYWSRRPGFVALLVLPMALGIGTTAAMFAVANDVFLRPLPWPDADRLALVYGVAPQHRGERADWNRRAYPWGALGDLKQVAEFESLGAWTADQWAIGPARSELVPVMHASASLPALLGGRQTLGRVFTVDEDQSADHVVLVTDDAWRRHFGGRRDVVGETVALGFASPTAEQRLYTVVGVLSAETRFPADAPDFIFPLGLVPQGWRESEQGIFSVVARLRTPPASRLTDGSTEVPVFQEGRSTTMTARLVMLADHHASAVRRPVALLFAGACLLLLIACANVAGLLAGEARVRRREWAVRMALGLDRRRLFAQSAAEHGLMVGTGAVAGLVLAGWFTPLFVNMLPSSLVGVVSAQIDWRVAAFAIVAVMASVVAFGLGPTLALTRVSAVEALGGGDRSGTGQHHRWQRAVATLAVGMAIVLLVATSLLSETILRLTLRPLGFQPDRLVVLRTTQTRPFPVDPTALETRRAQLARGLRPPPPPNPYLPHARGLLERLTALPGVVAAAAATAAPFAGVPRQVEVVVGGSRASGTGHSLSVTETYFRTMGTPMLEGRDFQTSDVGRRLAIVSRAFEREFLAGNGLGRQFHVGSSQTPLTVIGVVPDVPMRDVSEPAMTVYYSAGVIGELFTLVRVDRDSANVLPTLRAAIKQYDSGLVVTSSVTMDALLADSLAEQRFGALLSSLYGVVGLTLAALGLYALATRLVADRRHEIGVRMALGASPAAIRRLVLTGTFRIVAVGVAVGVPAALVGAQLLAGFLFGVGTTSTRPVIIASSLVAAVTFIATMAPARRAARIDPVRVLSAE
jgi:predicted permease